MSDLPQRIETCRRHGLEVSDDGFYPTATGPVHIDDSELGRVLLAHDDLLAACEAISRVADDPRSCMFTPCPGPDAAPVDMATCKFCSAARLARQAIAGEGRAASVHDDLLAALRGMVEMFEHRIYNRPGPIDAAQRWDAARAASAKAEGKNDE